MGSDHFPTASLAEVATFINGDRSSNYPGPDDYLEGGVPFVSASDLQDERIQALTVKRITPSAFGRLRAGKFEARDVLFCLRGSIGKLAMVREGETGAIASSLVIVRARTGVDPRFLFAFLRSAAGRQSALSLNNGSAQPNVSVQQLQNVRLPLPPFAAQSAISDALSALDDRITLLRETNATLEAIAQTLFKSWFVDFDPVRAKLQGLAPAGMDEATAALFPDSFEESALGLVPKGWRQGTINDFAEVHRGSVNPGGSGDTLFEHYSLPAFDAGQMPVRELGAEIRSNKTSVPRDAVLLSKLNPHIPRVWLPVDVGQHAVCSTEFLVFVPTGRASREFAYCFFVAAQFQQKLRQLVTGTSNSHQRVRPDGVATLSAVVPPGQALEAFTSIVRPVFERVGRSRLQAQTLATLRDTLLPRLITGQLRLPEAMAAAEEVV